MSIVSGPIQGALGYQASSKAADAQAASSRFAATMEFIMWKQGMKTMQPFLESAEKMLPYQEEMAQSYAELAAKGPGDFETSGYRRAMQAGIEDAARTMATKGSATGQGYGRDLVRYGTQLADQYYGKHLGDWESRLGAYQGQPHSQYSQYPALASQQAGMLGSALGTYGLYGGASQAAGYYGGAQALSGGVGSLSGGLAGLYESGALGKGWSALQGVFKSAPATKMGTKYVTGPILGI